MNRRPLLVKQHSPHRLFPLGQLSWLSWLRPLGLLPILALTALIAPFVPAPPGSVHWHGAQTVCTEVGAVVLLMALLCYPWRFSSLTAFGLNRCLPLVFLSLLFLWGLVSCLLSPTPFAVQGLLLLGVGVLVAVSTAAQANSTSRVLLAAASVVLPAVLVALSGFAQIGNGKTLAVGVLQDHQLFGAFLLISIPLCLAVSLAPGPLTQRLTGQVALLICAAGLWESQNRSAWLGTLASLGIFAGLFFFAASRSPAQARRSGKNTSQKDTLVPALLGIVAVTGFVLISPNQDMLFARMRSTEPAIHSSDDSLRWRKTVWFGTRRMIVEKPFVGWGVGSYPVQHEPWTRTGHSAEVVWEQGPSIEDEAHNSYLQIWAELGIVGLLLWLGAFFSLIGSGMQNVSRLKHGSLEQWLLIGGVSAVAGQMADALANPAWQFGNILLPLWIIFGLTAALSAPSRAAQVPPTRPLFWRIAQCSFAAALALWLLSLVWRTAFALPAPHL
jgi:O-antigen ligase